MGVTAYCQRNGSLRTKLLLDRDLEKEEAMSLCLQGAVELVHRQYNLEVMFVSITMSSSSANLYEYLTTGYHETIGPMKESAVWVEEAPLLLIWGRRSLSPSSYQHEDPLGLSVEGNDKKFPEDDLHELFPNCSGDISADNFSASWFLLENHHATSFNDLKAGYVYL